MDACQVVAVLQGKAEAPPTNFVSCKQPLDQPALAEIASALSCKSNAGVTGLRLEGCTIGDKGARLLADALCSNTELQTLELPNNYIGSEGAAAFAQVLQSQNCVLKVLDLTGNPCEFTAAGVLQEIEKCLTRNRVIKRACDRRTFPSPSAQTVSSPGFANTPLAGRKLCYWPSPPENQRLETEQRLQQLEDNYGMLHSEIEHIKRLGSTWEAWSKQIDAASTQLAAVLNLVDATSKDNMHRIVALELWKAAADSASNQVSKVLQKLNEDIKYVGGRLARLETEASGDAAPNIFLGPTIVEIDEEPPPSERASCSKVKPPPLLCPSAAGTFADPAADAQPGPSTGAAAGNSAGCTGQSTPAAIPSTPRSLHSSLSDLRVPSPSQTPTHLSPVTWHDNATAMAASLEGLNLRNTNSTPSATSAPSVPDNGEASPPPEAEPAVEVIPDRQRELEIRLQEQQAITDKLAARLEQLERLLAHTAELTSATAPAAAVDCAVQTVPEFHWLAQEEDPHCSVSATTIANNHLHRRSADSVVGALSDTAGPSSKLLANPSYSTVKQQSIHSSFQLAPVLAQTQHETSSSQHTTPSKEQFTCSQERFASLKENLVRKNPQPSSLSDTQGHQDTPQKSQATSNRLSHRLDSSVSAHTKPASSASASPALVQAAIATSNSAALPTAPTASSGTASHMLHSHEFAPSLGSPHTPAQPAVTRPPVNPALWMSSSTMLTAASEASDSDMYQNLLRFVDGLNPNSMGVDLAEKLALLARASQALSQREDLEQARDQHQVVSAAPPGITPRSSTQSISAMDMPASASMCPSPAGRSPVGAAPSGVMPFPLHFNAMSASYESSGVDECNPSSCRSSPFRPKSASQLTSPGAAVSAAITSPTTPIIERVGRSAAGNMETSFVSTSVATSQGSNQFVPLVSAEAATLTSNHGANSSAFSSEWPSSNEFQPLLDNRQWSSNQPCPPAAAFTPLDPPEDDLSSLVRDVINQVDQNSSCPKHTSRLNAPNAKASTITSPVLGGGNFPMAWGPIEHSEPVTPGTTPCTAESNGISASAHHTQDNSPSIPHVSDSPNLEPGTIVADIAPGVQDDANNASAAVLQGSFPAPVADIGGSADLQLPDGRRRPSTLPVLPEARELPVDVSRTLPISPTPPTPPNSAADFLPTLFNVPAANTLTAAPPPSPASAQPSTAKSLVSQPLQQSGSNDGSLLLGSVSVRGSHAPAMDASLAPVNEASAPAVMSRVARVTSRPIPVNETLKASDELSQGHFQHAKAGGSSAASVPSTPSSSASSTPRPGGGSSTRHSRCRSAASTTPTPRSSGGHLRNTIKPGEIPANGSLKTPKSESRTVCLTSGLAQPTGSEGKSSAAKGTSTPFRDASMQRFLLRRGIGKKGATGSPTAGNSSGTYSGGKIAPEYQSRSGKPIGGLEQNMEVEAKGLIPASQGTQGKKKLMRTAVNFMTRPIKALMGNAQDMPLRMHGTRNRRKSSMCPETSSNDVSLMLAPRALSENTAAYYRYAEGNQSQDAASGGTLSLVRRMMSETSAGQLHSHRYK